MTMSLVVWRRILVTTYAATFPKPAFYWFVVEFLFLFFANFVFNYLILFIVFLFFFNYSQLDNKKLDALKKSKDRSAIMQVSNFSIGNCFLQDQ